MAAGATAGLATWAPVRRHWWVALVAWPPGLRAEDTGGQATSAPGPSQTLVGEPPLAPIPAGATGGLATRAQEGGTAGLATWAPSPSQTLVDKPPVLRRVALVACPPVLRAEDTGGQATSATRSEVPPPHACSSSCRQRRVTVAAGGTGGLATSAPSPSQTLVGEPPLAPIPGGCHWWLGHQGSGGWHWWLVHQCSGPKTLVDKPPVPPDRRYRRLTPVRRLVANDGEWHGWLGHLGSEPVADTGGQAISGTRSEVPPPHACSLSCRQRRVTVAGGTAGLATWAPGRRHWWTSHPWHPFRRSAASPRDAADPGHGPRVLSCRRSVVRGRVR